MIPGMLLMLLLMQQGPDPRLIVDAPAARFTIIKEPAAPFGLKMGMPTASLDINVESRDMPFMFALKSVPNPHPDFELYSVKSTPKTGLCSILVTSKRIETNRFGHQLMDAFTRIRSEIESVHGKPYIVRDELLDGSLWTNPEYWMRGLIEKDRRLVAQWYHPEQVQWSRPEQVKPTIESIFLQVSADASDRGHLDLFYDFNNNKSCDEEIAAKKKSPF